MRSVLGVLVLSLLVVAVGCQSELDGTSPTPGPGVMEESWPGGTVGGWEDGDGVEESYTRRPGDGGGSGDGATDEAGFADDDAAPGPPPGEPGADPNNGGGLEGGEIDDNELFDAFLEFTDSVLEEFPEEPMIHWMDVSRRHFITVTDNQGRPVQDALVAVMSDGEVVAAGRSHGDGRYAFFPRAVGSDEPIYTVEVFAGQDFAQAALEEGQDTLEVSLEGAQPALASCQVDVAFMIDATGSMGGEIARIKDTITEIAGRISESEHSPDLRLGLVDYRDRGDDYVTHAVNFTRDVPAFQRAIDGLEANGGGDMPEALNEALHDGMRRLDWRSESTLRLAFVVADAPAHHYDDAQYTYDQAMLDASVMGITLYPIASGGSDQVAEMQFRQLAQYTQGNFIFITRGNGSSEGSEGSEYDVNPEDFDVQSLDDLVVRLINDGMADWCQNVQRPQ